MWRPDGRRPPQYAIPMGGQVALNAGAAERVTLAGRPLPCTSCGLHPAHCCCPGGPEA